jgi:hypothetical protein
MLSKRNVLIALFSPKWHKFLRIPQVRVAERPRSRAEEIRVERDDVGPIEVIDRVDVLTEGLLGALPRGVATARLILMLLCLGELREQRCDLIREGRRGDGARQDAQPRALPEEEIGAILLD